jgi:hypothetical protein
MPESTPASVELDTDTYDSIERRVSKTEFSSVDQYVEYVMDEVITAVGANETETSEEVDEDQVKDRLESLGYLDT